MRFRFGSMSISSLVLLVTSTYVIYLGAMGQLDLYIHPRYIAFTMVLSVLGLIATIMHCYYSENGKEDGHASKMLLIPMVVIIGSAILLPARTLTSSTVSQRATDSGSIVASSDSTRNSTLFAGSSKGLRLQDWSRVLAANEDPDYYVNKPAKLSGFIYDADLGGDTVWIARFVLTCCAVDAQPVGVPVQIENWRGDFSQDQWIEIEGEFGLAETSKGEQLVLIPDTISQIDEPDNPYAN